MKIFMNKENKIYKSELINGVITPQSEMILIGNKTLIAEGASSVLEFNDDSIKLKLADLTIQIYGASLSIAYLNRDNLEINGKISRVEFI